MKVAHVSTFPEMRCGIAFYVSDLIHSLPEFQHAKYALHYGDNLTPDALCTADVADVFQLKQLARQISDSDCDVISLQHEFGIWGGMKGEHILSFLDATQKPIVSTLHTTFRINDRPPIQTSILRRLTGASASSIVLTNESRNTLCATLGIPADALHVIPHGVPQVPFSIPKTPSTPHAEWQLCSIGFFRPDKGVEQTIEALALLKSRGGMRFRYVIAGSPQPQFDGQAEYRRELKERIASLGLQESVVIDDRFLSRKEQIELIANSHAGVFSYQTAYQCSSGTIPLVLSVGRPVICTPFEFAKAKKEECGQSVVISKGFDPESIATAIDSCFANERDYLAHALSLRGKGDEWSWRAVATSYRVHLMKAIGKKSAVVR